MLRELKHKGSSNGREKNIDLAKSEAENIPRVHDKDLTSVTMTKDAWVVEYHVNDDIQLKRTFKMTCLNN